MIIDWTRLSIPMFISPYSVHLNTAWIISDLDRTPHHTHLSTSKPRWAERRFKKKSKSVQESNPGSPLQTSLNIT